MNVSCSECESVFRVDPAKVPAEGVRARCNVCGGVFDVAVAGVPAGVGPELAAAPPAAHAVIAHPSDAGRSAAPSKEESRAGRPFNPYLSNTPELRARRLARALVSDLVAYNPQKREQGLRDGTLRQLFREEIRKSWEEYVEQVGANVAESTPHFQDALNDVLAGGRRVF